MTRRSAFLSLLATIVGTKITQSSTMPEQTQNEGFVRPGLSFLKVTEFRWILGPEVKIVVAFGAERVEYTAGEVFEALRRPAGEQR